MTFAGSQTLGGTGEVVFNGSSASIKGSGGTLTIGAGVTVRTGTFGGTVGSPTQPLINSGVVESRGGVAVTVAGTTLTNGGTLRAAENGTLTLGAVLDGGGTIEAGVGSTVFDARGVQGRLDVAGKVALRPRAARRGHAGDEGTEPGGAPGGWTGKLDLADGALVVDYAGSGNSPLPTIADQLKLGRGTADKWDGAGGIVSSVVAGRTGSALGYAEASETIALSGSQTATWQGQTVDATSVLVRYTIGGDANLDGVVNFTDLLAVARHYNASGDAATWGTGDFDYDGRVNFNDLLRVARNYNLALPGAVAGASVEFNADFAAAVAAAVPEPSVGGLVVGAGVVLRARRRRRI